MKPFPYIYIVPVPYSPSRLPRFLKEPRFLSQEFFDLWNRSLVTHSGRFAVLVDPDAK